MTTRRSRNTVKALSLATLLFMAFQLVGCSQSSVSVNGLVVGPKALPLHILEGSTASAPPSTTFRIDQLSCQLVADRGTPTLVMRFEVLKAPDTSQLFFMSTVDGIETGAALDIIEIDAVAGDQTAKVNVALGESPDFVDIAKSQGAECGLQYLGSDSSNMESVANRVVYGPINATTERVLAPTPPAGSS